MASVKEVKTQKGIAYKIEILKGRAADGRREFYFETYHPKATGPKAAYKETVAYAEGLEQRIKNGEVIVSDKLTFSDLVDEWRQSKRYNDLTTSIREQYEAVLSMDDLAELMQAKVKQITVRYMQNVVNALSTNKKTGQPRKLSSVQKIVTVLRGIFRNAYRLEIIERDPMDRIELPSAKNADDQEEQLHFFDIEPARRFLSYLDDTFEADTSRQEMTRKDSQGNVYSVKGYKRIAKITISNQWKCYFTLAILAGFRRGEMVALQWQDISFDQHTISINKAAASTAEGQIIKRPKTAAGRRTIVLPEEVFDRLAEWEIEQKNTCIKLGSAWEGQPLRKFGEQFVFMTETGGMMHLSTPTHKFKEILAMINRQIEKEADCIADPDLREKKLAERLPDLRLHDLRHTAASLMVASGINIKTVSSRLGHSRTAITLERYSHALPSQDEVASNVLAGLFFDRNDDKAIQA